MKGCLGWLGAMAVVGIVVVMVLAGLVIALATDAPSWHWLGTGLVAAAGAVTIVAARSGRFARSVVATVDPLETGAVAAVEAFHGDDPAAAPIGDDPFQGRTGRHALPVGIGIGLLLLAAIMAAYALFP